jgi:hypothetical protein
MIVVGLAKSPAAQVKLKQIAAALILLTLFLPHGIATELQLRKSNMVLLYEGLATSVTKHHLGIGEIGSP